MGKQSVTGAVPVFSGVQRQLIIGAEIRDRRLEDSILSFHVTAENIGGQLHFTLTVSGDTMTWTACGEACATLKLKKATI